MMDGSVHEYPPGILNTGARTLEVVIDTKKTITDISLPVQ